MTAQIILFDFTVPDDQDIHVCLEKLVSGLSDHIPGELSLEMKHTGAALTTWCYSGPGDSLVTIRLHSHTRLITVNVDGLSLCPSANNFKDTSSFTESLWSSQHELSSYASNLAKSNGIKEFNWIPTITRGLKLSPYWGTSDERIVEMSITEIVHETTSKYQRIQILDSVDYGRMLLLDGAIQLSESDGIYTSTLMSDLCYDDADVLILGGGDGALLAKLVTDHSPRMVTMVELDGEVMTSVRDHMHSVTGGVLDHHTGDNYNIITGDAVQHLEDCVKDGKQYDFIFGDLTDVPIDTDPEASELWDFITKILQLSLSSVKLNGKYLTHLYGKTFPQVKETFKQKVNSAANEIDREIEITFSEAFVPSFMEVWVFAQVTLKS